MNVSELLARNARKMPNQEAIIDGQVRINYRDFHNNVNLLVASFDNQGIKKGDRVILFMPNTKEFLYTYFAVLRLGAIIVPISARLTTPEIEYILAHSGGTAIVAHQLLFEQVKDLPKKYNLLCVKTGQEDGKWKSFEQFMGVGQGTELACQQSEEDDATILYTSGTTGNPKGVLFTHRNILSVATMICIEMTMKPTSRILHMMPLSHSAPLHLFLVSGTYVGATHVLAPTFTPELLLKLVAEEKTTHFFGAPVAYLFTAKHPKVTDYDLSSMEYWVYGGSPLGTNEVQFISQKFNTENLQCVYGLTEAGPNGTLLAKEEHALKAGSIGKRAALNCEIKLINDHGEDVEQGEVGEIALYGEGNMKAYYKNEELTMSAFKDGWLLTGDMAKMDEDGFIWVVDRKKDLIISGGVNIFPMEIEELLVSHPNITEAAVVGVPHADWGETVKAFIVVKEISENIEADCKSFLEGKLAHNKVPRLYEVINELPRNPTGKILKTKLRA